MNELVKQDVMTPAVPGFNFFNKDTFDTALRVSKLFASSDLVPDNYKPTLQTIPANATQEVAAAIQASNTAATNKAIANCLIALEVATRIGASPLMVMQNMVPIYGKPSWSSKFLIATVNSCGRFEPLQYRFTEKGMLGMVDYVDYEWNGQSRRKEAVKKQYDGRKVMDIECVAYTTKKGSKNVLESSPVSIRLAIQEGWYTKNGSKWQTMAKQMLMYRAASFWTSAYAPDLSMGLRTIEEQQDIADIQEAEVVDVFAEREKAANANRVVIGVDLAAQGEESKSVVMAIPTTEAPSNEPEKKEEPAPANPGF